MSFVILRYAEQRYFIMRHKFLTLFSILTLTSCLLQNPNELSSFDDGIYSWNPYPNQYFGYLDIEDAYLNSYAQDDFNDGYEEGYFDAYNSRYPSPYISFRPTRRNWSYSRNAFFPSYYNGFNNPWNYGYNYSYGLNNNWNYGFNNLYGFNEPWSYRRIGYGYGFNNSWYGNRYNCFGCNNGWNNSGWNNSGWNNIGNSVSSEPDPVSSNISIRRLNLNSSLPARRPGVTNKLNGGRVLNPKLTESRSDIQRAQIKVEDLTNILTIKSEPLKNKKKFSSLLDNNKSNGLNYSDRNASNARKSNDKSNNYGSLNTRRNSTRSYNTASSKPRTFKPKTSNTRSSTTRSSNTRSSNTRSSKPRTSNTRSSNTRSSKPRTSNTRSSTSKRGGK